MDHHSKPFDEVTKLKLHIFKEYTKEWLPVFLAPKNVIWKTINIFDFFAGPGEDSNGTLGTPMLILNEIEAYLKHISIKALRVNIYFNEYDKTKYKFLSDKIFSLGLKPYNIYPSNQDFQDCFNHLYPLMQGSDVANLVLLDQNGIKQINTEVFQKIISLKTTDFIFFISSSTLKRFSEHPNILKHINIEKENLIKTDYHKIHRLITEYYRSLIPERKEYYIAPFSLKKDSGIYGLVFGSRHVLGIEKFLKLVWKLDPERGEANFDIDKENIQKHQYDLFSNKPSKPKKIEDFENELSNLILIGLLKTDKDVYLYTLNNSFAPKQACDVLDDLIYENKIVSKKFNLNNKVCKKDAIITQIILLT